jgi:hypothetical protein
VRRAALVVGVAIVIAATSAVILRSRAAPGDGPVFAGAGTEAGQRLEVGEPFSFGFVLLRNEAKLPAKIEKVRLLGLTGGLELLGISSRAVPDEQGKGMFLEAFGYPPHDWASQPLAGDHIVPVAKTRTPAGTPGEGLELVIGVKATKAGVARARAVEFTYTVGGHRYREVYDGSMYLCAPKDQFTAETCPGDAHGRFDDTNAEVRVS